MALVDFRKAKYCNQRDKDTVYGYIKQIQAILPFEANSYFTIVQLIQDLILLYFYQILDTKILTDEDQSNLFEMLRNQTNDKFMKLLTYTSVSFNLIYESSKESLDREKFVSTVYEKKNILIIVHSRNNNIFFCNLW